jgi:thioredoxin reductase (NADPH)
VPGIAAHEGKRLHYRVRDPQGFTDRNVVIAGGGDSALDWALALSAHARSVTLVHRRDEFRAAPASVEKFRALCAAGRGRILVGNVREIIERDGDLVGVRVGSRDTAAETVDLDQLLVFFGLHPKLGPIAEWGFELAKKQIPVDTATFATSVPGIYAVGDINTYPGKKKLILSGFHEAALAAFSIKEFLEPGKKVPLQYTTTSPIMHRRLGVAGEGSDRRHAANE